jgi:hypothetical protein
MFSSSHPEDPAHFSRARDLARIGSHRSLPPRSQNRRHALPLLSFALFAVKSS